MANTFYDIEGVTTIRHEDGLPEVECNGKRFGRQELVHRFMGHYHRYVRKFPGMFFDRYIHDRADLVRRYITAFGYTREETAKLIADLLNSLHNAGVLTDESYAKLATV